MAQIVVYGRRAALRDRRAALSRVEREAGITAQSLEITITETPRVNWGIRGANGADLALGYQVEV